MTRMLVIDADYFYNVRNEPVIRLYGKEVGGDNEGSNFILYVENFEPYLYLDGCGYNIDKLVNLVDIACKGYIKRIEKVYRYRPIGYQEIKQEMLRLVLYNPRVTPDVRQMLPEKIEGVDDSKIYEADILFRDRFLIDMGISGMSVIEFNANMLEGVEMSCKNTYICGLDMIKVTNDIVKLEY